MRYTGLTKGDHGGYRATNLYKIQSEAILAAKRMTNQDVDRANYIGDAPYTITFAVPVEGSVVQNVLLYPAVKGKADGRSLVLCKTAVARQQIIAAAKKDLPVIAAGDALILR